MKKVLLILLLIVIVACAAPPTPDSTPAVSLLQREGTRTPKPTNTPRVTPTLTNTTTPTKQPTATPTSTPPATVTNVPTDTPDEPIEPFASAPECLEHNPTIWHGLWDDKLGCHYTNTHGMAQPDWALTLFGDYTLYTNGQELSYPWQTFSAHGSEVDVKPNGYKRHWQDIRDYPCTPNLNNQYSVNAYFVESHNLATEMEYTGRVHSFFGMAQLCDPSNPDYHGLVIAGGHSDFGQMVSPYQGAIVPKTNTPLPSYPSPKPPYFSIDCVGSPPCRPLLPRTLNSNWDGQNNSGSAAINNHFFQFGFRQEDIYIYLDESQLDNPDPQFTLYCANEDGSYNPVGCWNNGTTFTVYKIVITIPGEWDGLAGFDEDGVKDGFVNFHGYGDLQGNPNPECMHYNENCTPLVLENVPVREASVNLFSVDPEAFPAFGNIPDYEVCFLADGTHVDCSEEDAIPSGWVGESN